MDLKGVSVRSGSGPASLCWGHPAILENKLWVWLLVGPSLRGMQSETWILRRWPLPGGTSSILPTGA